jgi:hypothetical protein
MKHDQNEICQRTSKQSLSKFENPNDQMTTLHIFFQILLFTIILGLGLIFTKLCSAVQIPLNSIIEKYAAFGRKWSYAIFFSVNLIGTFTTDLLSLTWFHITELLLLALLFIHDAFAHSMTLTFRARHILAIIGVCLQIHIGVGGATMSYLLCDQVTDYIRNAKAFWITFFVVRICFYNGVLAIAVRQGIQAAVSSLAIKIWVGCVITWWVFSNFYHFYWAWKDREQIKQIFWTNDR